MTERPASLNEVCDSSQRMWDENKNILSETRLTFCEKIYVLEKMVDVLKKYGLSGRKCRLSGKMVDFLEKKW